MNTIKSTDSRFRKRRSDNLMKLTCFYLYYIFHVLDETAEITLNKNSKQVVVPDEYMKYFPCKQIKSRGKVVFEEGVQYKVHYDDQLKINTIQFDETTELPIKVSDKKIRQTANESCRAQQHILVTLINKRLKERGEKTELEMYSKRRTEKSLGNILFNQYIDVDSENNLVLINKYQNQKSFFRKETLFDELVDVLKTFFDWFLNDQKGITSQLIIADEGMDSFITTTENCIHMKRDYFFRIIHNIRFDHLDMNEIVDIPVYRKTNQIPFPHHDDFSH